MEMLESAKYYNEGKEIGKNMLKLMQSFTFYRWSPKTLSFTVNKTLDDHKDDSVMDFVKAREKQDLERRVLANLDGKYIKWIKSRDNIQRESILMHEYFKFRRKIKEEHEDSDPNLILDDLGFEGKEIVSERKNDLAMFKSRFEGICAEIEQTLKL